MKTFAALLILAATALALGVWWLQPHSDPGPSGSFPLRVEGPDGWLWQANITLPGPATVLAQIQMASSEHGLRLVVEDQGLGAYVRGIGPFDETKNGGWNFCIDAGQGRQWVANSADAQALHPGDQVVWAWVEDGGNSCFPAGHVA